MRISQIDWGNDTAESDEHLLEYFVRSRAFERLSQKKKSIVIGRKGAGKSALLKKLDEHFSSQENEYVVKIQPDFTFCPKSHDDEEITNEIFFKMAWLKNIFTTILCKFGSTQDNNVDSDSVRYAKQFAKDHGRGGVSFIDDVCFMIERLKVQAGKYGEFGISVDKSLKKVSDIDILSHHVSELCKSGFSFVVMVDDLDVGWENNDITNKAILGLLLATTYLNSFDKIHPIIFLREDVYTILMTKTQHSDKYRDIERIRWEHDELMSVLDQRINYNRAKHGLDPVEGALHEVFPVTVGTSNTDNWLVERTLSRPRELIQFARFYTENLADDVPSSDVLKNVENQYSSWKLDDLCTERSKQYPELNKFFECWSSQHSRVKYHLTKQDIIDILLEIVVSVDIKSEWFQRVVDETDFDLLLKVLYDVGFIGDFVLGGSGGSRTYYSYQDPHEPKFEEVQIHPCFRPAVKTVQRIR